MKIDKNLICRLYGGWIGKVIGVIHGANTEGWTYEKIGRVFGEITTYPFFFRRFAADDDINGPLFFQRVLLDHGNVDVGSCEDTFLNYVSDGHGFFWWGGYGVSTEHTAYKNLVSGAKTGTSGTRMLNGKVLANQIGGQIFSDCWGFLNLGNETQAARMAATMASVTHDEDGLEGARFISGAIAAAYDSKSVTEIFERAFALLDPGSGYASMARDVWNYCNTNPDSWRSAFAYVSEKYGYQHYQGVCHIIPNAAVIVLSLYYGGGDFSKTINIANMCGWDTDCNVGNLGSILGVYNSIHGIDPSWLGMVNDFICASSSMGYLNIQTVSDAAMLSLRLISKLYDCPLPRGWSEAAKKNEGQLFHFFFPTSTHSFSTRSGDGVPVKLENISKMDKDGNIVKSGLGIIVPMIENNQGFSIFYNSYYTPGMFDDNRYLPDLSPKIYPGDTIAASFSTKDCGRIRLTPFFKDRISGRIFQMEKESVLVEGCSDFELRFRIPSSWNIIVEEIGWTVLACNVAARETKTDLSLTLKSVEIIDSPSYSMDCGRIPTEVWTAVDTCPAGFSYLRGAMEICDGALSFSSCDLPTELYTGNTNWRNIAFEASFIPNSGNQHYVLFSVQGSSRSFLAGFENECFVVKKKASRGYSTLFSTQFAWRHGEKAVVRVELKDKNACIFANGIRIACLDGLETGGCIGFANEKFSNTSVLEYSVESI